MSSKNIYKTSFWQLLNNSKIEIPIIQRDYAQGRIGKEKLREKFLKDLKHALDSKSVLKLDFVYGSTENGRFNPLDGQQRLTTLWLLNWYIAMRAGMIGSDEISIFKNFTYETRASSREFCDKLSEYNSFKSERGTRKIIEVIEKQTWFYTSWKQDPTIQAMLHMLGGTLIKNKNDEDYIDGLEEVFNDTSEEEFIGYWELLISKDCPIIFFKLNLEGLSLSDDLYIKMNARGKSLSSFENFKADLVRYIKDKSLEVKDVPPQNSFTHKLDTKWTDLFWRFKSPKNKIDEIYYAFINRFFFGKLITNDSVSVERLVNEKSFKHLYGNSSDDSKLGYDAFDVYDFIDESIVGSLETVFGNVSEAFSLSEFNNLISPNWSSENYFSLIPEYVDKSITHLTRIQRVVFYAILCYFEVGGYDEKSFSRWMRVIWNIVENSNINTIAAMIGAMRLIDKLAKGANCILEYLEENEFSKSFAETQLKEEKEKARMILEYPEWEDKIVDAENTAFFNGAIRFLFTMNDRSYNWGKFDERIAKAKKYFDDGGVVEYYRRDAILLRNLISHFSEWEQFKKIVYDNNAESWKDILLTEKWLCPVNILLDLECINSIAYASFASELPENYQKGIQNDLVNSALLSVVQAKCKFHWRYNKATLYPPNAKANKKKYVISDIRNAVLSELVSDGTIYCEQHLKDTNHFWGWDIYFKTNDSDYKLDIGGAFYVKDKDGVWGLIKGVEISNMRNYLSGSLTFDLNKNICR